MPNGRRGERCDDIHATALDCIRLARHCTWLLWVLLALSLLIFWRVFF